MRQLLNRAEANARANGRDVVPPADLPLSSGLPRSIHRFRILNAELQLNEHFKQLVGLPAIDLAYGAETEARLPEMAGALCLALGQCFRIFDEELEQPGSDHWDRAEPLFELLL